MNAMTSNDQQNSQEEKILHRMEKLRDKNLSYEALLRYAAEGWDWADFMEAAYEQQQDLLNMQEQALTMSSDAATALRQVIDGLLDGLGLSTDVIQKTRLALPKLIAHEIAAARSSSAKSAINVRHSKPGGSREKKARLQAIWASGKYSSRSVCAEEECAGLGMSYETARKALINTQNPS